MRCTSFAVVQSIALFTLASLAGSTRGGVLIGGGPGGELINGSGQLNPTQPLAPGRPIHASGQSIGQISLFLNNQDQSRRAAVWSIKTGATLLAPLNNVFGATAAYASNGSGFIVGQSTAGSGNTDHGTRAAYWMPGTSTPRELPALSVNDVGLAHAVAHDINDNGAVVGYSDLYNGATALGPRAVRWNTTNNVNATLPAATSLGVLNTKAGGYGWSEARYVNGGGTIVGHSIRYGANGVELGMRPVRWSASATTPTELGHLGARSDGFVTGLVMGLAENGAATGAVEIFDGENSLGRRAVRWNAGTTAATRLDDLGTDVNGVGNAYGYSINTRGAVVGYSTEYDADHNPIAWRPVRWNAGSTAATRLLGVGARQQGVASSINSLGVSTGLIFDNSFNFADGRAAMWLPNATQAIDLTSFIDPERHGHWTLTEAAGITDTGYITGSGMMDPDGPTGPRAAFKQLFTILVPQAGTYGRGDANFDGKVNFDDLLRLASHFNQENWSNATNVGDFNLDGWTNFNDLLALAAHFNTGRDGLPLTPSLAAAGLSDDFAAQWALAQSLVPEPTILGGMMFAGSIVTRRRRSQR